MYAVVLRICRGTNDVFVQVMSCIGDDKPVCQNAKHSRRALQAIGDHLLHDLVSTMGTYDIRSRVFVHLSMHTALGG